MALKIGNSQADKSPSSIAKAYHKAKADGSNPELVQAVESLLSSGQSVVSETAVTETTPATQETPVTPATPTLATNPTLADVESTAKALEGVGKGSIKNSSELDSVISKIESDTPYTIRKTFNKDSELISISDNTKAHSPKSKRGRELMNMIIDPLTGNSPKNMKYIGISSGQAYAEFDLIDKTRGQYISEAYHKAKADGSNRELVEAVEKLLSSPNEKEPANANTSIQEEVESLKSILEYFDGEEREYIEIQIEILLDALKSQSHFS